MIALYAITDYPTPPLPAPGALRAVAVGDLAAVCGPVAKGEVTADALWQHEQIIEGLMDDRDVLPVRYGTCVPDVAAAARAVEDKYTEFATSLESVRGAVELAVRVFASETARHPPVRSAEPMTGTAYLRVRARAAAAESDAMTIVHAPLALTARAETVARVNRPGELLRAAYLIDRGATESFSARVQKIQQDNPQLRLTCTGPWPAYSFVMR